MLAVLMSLLAYSTKRYTRSVVEGARILNHREHRGSQRKKGCLCEPLCPLWFSAFAERFSKPGRWDSCPCVSIRGSKSLSIR